MVSVCLDCKSTKINENFSFSRYSISLIIFVTFTGGNL